MIISLTHYILYSYFHLQSCAFLWVVNFWCRTTGSTSLNTFTAFHRWENMSCHDRRHERLYWTGTLYLLFQTLVVPSLITVSKYRIQNTNKTTTALVFTVSYTYSLESHLHIQNIYIYIYKSERGIYYDKPLLVCWPSYMRKIANVLLCTYMD